MFLHLSVILFTEGSLSGGLCSLFRGRGDLCQVGLCPEGLCPEGLCPGGSLSEGVSNGDPPPPQYGVRPVGTNPIGMHSCLFLVISPVSSFGK